METGGNAAWSDELEESYACLASLIPRTFLGKV